MEFTPEQKAHIATQIEEATAGLVAKNTELLTEVKTLKKGKTIDPSDMQKLEDKVDALSTENAALIKANKAALKDADTAKNALTQESTFTASLLVDQGLISALTANGVVNPALLKGAVAMLKAQGVAVVIEGDKRIAKLGDKPLDVVVKAFVDSDEGKHYKSAQNSSGGGAGGGGGSLEPSKTMTRADFNTKSPVEQSTFSRGGGELTD